MKCPMTLDEALRPIEMTCGNCGAKMKVYPDADNGVGVCPNCSPNWLEGFAQYLMNQERQKHGLEPIK